MSIIIFLLFWLVGFFSVLAMLRRLRNAHEAVWTNLGKPAFGASGSVTSGLCVLRYLLGLRFWTAGDSKLAIAGTLSLVALLGCLAAGIGVVFQMF
jgi:hypothetical protein